MLETLRARVFAAFGGTAGGASAHGFRLAEKAGAGRRMGRFCWIEGAGGIYVPLNDRENHARLYAEIDCRSARRGEQARLHQPRPAFARRAAIARPARIRDDPQPPDPGNGMRSGFRPRSGCRERTQAAARQRRNPRPHGPGTRRTRARGNPLPNRIRKQCRKHMVQPRRPCRARRGSPAPVVRGLPFQRNTPRQ